MLLVVAFLLMLSADAQLAIVKGKIMSANDPVPYAGVSLKDSKLRVIADSTGNFILNGIPAGTHILKVSYVGYIGVEKTISIHKGEEMVLNISLLPNNETLNEVVVTGVSKATLIKENPVSIVNITSKQIERTPESNIIDVLVKNTPG